MAHNMIPMKIEYGAYNIIVPLRFPLLDKCFISVVIGILQT